MGRHQDRVPQEDEETLVGATPSSPSSPTALVAAAEGGSEAPSQQRGAPLRFRCEAVRPLLVALGAGCVLALAAWRVAPRMDGLEATKFLHNSGLWSTRSEIRERVEPVTFGDRFGEDGELPLAEAPTCVTGELPLLWNYQEGGAPVEVKVLSYNLFWWSLYGVRDGNNGSAGRLISEAGRGRAHDIMAFQECMDPVRVLKDAGLEEEYGTFAGDGSNTAAICMAYHKKSWLLLESGSHYVAEDTKLQYFGKRAAQWMRLRHLVSGRTLLFVNHHGPLPVNSGGQCGGEAVAYNLLEVMAHKAHRGDALILAGDFNADATSETVRSLQKRLHKAYAGEVVNGIDNVFSNLGAGAVARASNLGSAGSDHDALSVTLTLTSRETTPPPRPEEHLTLGDLSALRGHVMRFQK